MKKALTLSIIIPVYNEERHLQECLDSIQQQTIAPDEVIVVDNNCTDNTIAIARRYPFVRVVQEKAQGLIPARNRGFGVAHGTILGRIDADSILPQDWVVRAKRAFDDADIWGITGLGKAIVDPHIKTWVSTYWCRMYFLQMEAYFCAPLLWGANMAISRRAWEAIRSDAATEDSKVHEDQDLALLIAAQGGKIIFDPNLLITVDGEQSAYLPKAMGYLGKLRSTRRLHQQMGTLARARAQVQISAHRRLFIICLMPLVLLMYVVLSGVYSLQLWLKQRIKPA